MKVKSNSNMWVVLTGLFFLSAVLAIVLQLIIMFNVSIIWATTYIIMMALIYLRVITQSDDHRISARTVIAWFLSSQLIVYVMVIFFFEPILVILNFTVIGSLYFMVESGKKV